MNNPYVHQTYTSWKGGKKKLIGMASAVLRLEKKLGRTMGASKFKSVDSYSPNDRMGY